MVDRRIDLRHIAIIEKEEGKYRAAKALLMLVLGVILLLLIWLFGPASKIPVALLKLATLVLFVSYAGWIWLIVDGLRDVIMANKYLRKWQR